MELLIKICEYVAAIGAGVAAVYQWIIKPLKKAWDKQVESFRQIGLKLDEMERKLDTTQDDVADVLGDRLLQAHEYFMAQGWATDADKQRFVDMHRRYSARGHNHLMATYEEDLLGLPSKPGRSDEE